ncbi:MAG: hypothetical protein RR942_02355 [Romboutsia sp.]
MVYFSLSIGLIVSAIEKFKELPFAYSKDQINGVINGFVCIIVGVVVLSNSIKQGITLGLFALALYYLERALIYQYLKKKKAK